MLPWVFTLLRASPSVGDFSWKERVEEIQMEPGSELRAWTTVRVIQRWALSLSLFYSVMYMQPLRLYTLTFKFLHF